MWEHLIVNGEIYVKMKDQTIDLNETPTGINKRFEKSLCLVYVQNDQRKTLEKLDRYFCLNQRPLTYTLITKKVSSQIEKTNYW